MKKRKQAMLSSLAMLIVAMITLTSTTFAWFTTGNTGTVDTITFTATDASGILISADASSWKSKITATEIATAISTGGTIDPQVDSMFTAETTTFTPVSSAGGITATDGKLDIFAADTDSSDANKKATTAAAAVTEAGKGKYYVFNLYINNQGSDAKTLALTTGTVADDSDANKNTSTAIRVAFIDQGNAKSVQDGKSADQVKTAVVGLAKTKGNDVKATIYEPNSTTHTSDASTYSGVTANTAATTNAVKAAKTGLEVDANGFIKSTETEAVAAATYFTDVTKTDGSNNVAELAANSITKLTVYVWLEGQDADCLNDIASGKVKLDMAFTATKKTS